jgi:hypothetical protein
MTVCDGGHGGGFLVSGGWVFAELGWGWKITSVKKKKKITHAKKKKGKKKGINSEKGRTGGVCCLHFLPCFVESFDSLVNLRKN